jgi:non-ribosomal peptide synthetase component E (peptide arylation enzyme)
MSIAFTPWSAELTQRYREAGYWLDLPLTDILDRQVNTRPHVTALICGERQLTYADLGRRVEALAAELLRRGLQRHDTALVQLPNVAEFYVTYFALLRIGVVPVNALFSHQRLELRAYATQIQPSLLIASREHGLFEDDAFNTELRQMAVALWLQAVPGQKHRLQSLRLLQVGGASFSEATARRVPLELGCSLQQVFGMAEGLVNYTRLDDDLAHVMGTQGRPMSLADEVRVLDQQGKPVAVGETGALATRGPYTFRGYYKSPEHNARAFDADGFYHSGDLVQQSEDGYLKVVGRIKDQINRGGEKIAAEEVEDLLMRHEAITQVGLVAMPDDMLGEKSCAYIVTSQADIKASQLRKFLRAQGVADYKLPDRFELVNSMPLTAVGKIDKQKLRAWAAVISHSTT